LRLAEQLAARPAHAGEVFNFSYEHPVTVLDLASRILPVMEFPEPERARG